MNPTPSLNDSTTHDGTRSNGMLSSCLERQQEQLAHFFQSLKHPLNGLMGDVPDLRLLLGAALHQIFAPTKQEASSPPKSDPNGQPPERLTAWFNAILEQHPLPWTNDELFVPSPHAPLPTSHHLRRVRKETPNDAAPVDRFAVCLDGTEWAFVQLQGGHVVSVEYDQEVLLSVSPHRVGELSDYIIADMGSMCSDSQQWFKDVAYADQHYDLATQEVCYQKIILDPRHWEGWRDSGIVYCEAIQKGIASPSVLYAVFKSISKQVWPAPDQPDLHNLSYRLSNPVRLFTIQGAQSHIALNPSQTTIDDWAGAHIIAQDASLRDALGIQCSDTRKKIMDTLIVDSILWVEHQSQKILLVSHSPCAQDVIDACQRMVEMRSLDIAMQEPKPSGMLDPDTIKPVKRKL